MLKKVLLITRTHSASHVCALLPSVLAAMPARFMLRVSNRVQHKALFVSIILALTTSTITMAATPSGTVINNTATATYNNGASSVSIPSPIATLTVGGLSPIKIEFLQFDPTGASPQQQVSTTSCGGSSLPAPTYITTPASGLAVPGALSLAPTTTYTNGDPLFIRITDLNQNKNPLVAETITTTVTTLSGDSETLTLTETGPSTGVFVGYIQTNSNAVAPNNCTLNAGDNQNITASYTDTPPAGAPITMTTKALVDPFGILFDSVTGVPANGASVTLISNATGLPANVLCDNGTTTLPQPVISGSNTICDPAMVAGGYRFPRVAPGNYHLRILPPGSYVFPSTNAAPAAGFVVVGPIGTGASYGGAFPLNPGPAVKIDVPLDSHTIGGSLVINKTTTKTLVAIGDFVPYSITIQNAAATVANNVVIADTFPQGFRYTKKSVRLNGVAIAEPNISKDGQTPSFNIGTIAAGATVTLNYVAEVAAGTKLGLADNIAYSTSQSSNIAHASVTVNEDLYRSKSLLVGRVIVGCNSKVEDDLVGLQGVRILLEDGTYITTDKDGRWHADNIRPGTHVVQLDKDSLPSNYEVMTCEANSRFAGRNYSQFVNIQGGTMWRANFYVQKIAGAKEDTSKPEALPTDGANQRQLQLIEKLPYNTEWLATATAGVEWLHPQANFQPALPVIKAAIKHAPGQVVTIKVNGEKVSGLNFDGSLQNSTKTVMLSTWSAIPIKNGDNLLNVTITDKEGKTVFEEKRTIHYGVSIAHAEFDEKLSHLLADGKTRPVIAVRMLDDAGKPVRRGVVGEFQINAPYQTLSQFEQIQREPLAARPGGKAHFEIGADGIANIELMPTTQTGEVVLSFDFGNSIQSNSSKPLNEIRAWLAPGQRDWVLVGFAEGTAEGKKLSGNMTALSNSGAADQLFDQNRVAFYAKGTIKGEYLLTMSYDSAKQRGQNPNNLKQAIDPNQYYTLYADATQPQFDAASASKLYLKIEKSQFYAMFGDYDTGLTVTELSRYSRTLNGVKSEYKGKQFSYNAFATQTSQAFKRDEIRGDGTSGLYHLTSGNIVQNSDKITIETRDRFHNEVIINSQSLQRYLDYDIDPILGTLFFHQPIQTFDSNLNPTYIVAEYESDDNKDAKLSYGGRAAYKPNEQTEIGLTHIHEGNVGNIGNLTGVDATYNYDAKTKIRTEYAETSSTLSGVKNSGDAWLVEATRQDEKTNARVYAREQQSGFGLGQQAAGENGTRKMGADGTYKLNLETQLQSEAYQQETLSTGEKRNVADAKVQWQKDALTADAGLRVVQDNNVQTNNSSDPTTQTSKQAIAGVSYALFEKKLVLHADVATSISGSSESSDFPNSLRLGADYKLNQQTTLFATQEFAEGTNIKANTTRVGMRTNPWQGGEMSAALGNEIQQDSDRLFASMGLTQRWQINEHWQADAGLDRSQTVKNTGTQLNTNVPLVSGGGLNGVAGDTSDFTAASIGAHYSDKLWSANSRAEYRTSSTDDKVNLLAGIQRNLDGGRSVAAGFTYTDISGTSANTINSTDLDIRVSAAYRPNDSSLIWLDRLDYISNNTADIINGDNAKKLVNNFNANYMPNRHMQIALQYGSKYVIDDISGSSYKGYTDLLGVELRYDVTAKWDVGIHGSMLHSWNGGQRDYAIGTSVGYNVMENAWVSVGYNIRGFTDNDFSDAEYRVKGFYFNVRVKFDQDTLGLNKPNTANPLERK